MKDKKDDVSARPNEKAENKGLFTGIFTERLRWWQVLLGLALVGYLTYGKYQESVQANNPKVIAPKVIAPVPAK